MAGLPCYLFNGGNGYHVLAQHSPHEAAWYVLSEMQVGAVFSYESSRQTTHTSHRQVPMWTTDY